MKYFVIGKYRDLEKEIIELTEADIKSNKNKSKNRKTRNVSRTNEVILHLINGEEYLLFSLPWLYPYINFGSNEMLEIMAKIKRETGIFPIIEVPDNEINEVK